jgi:hypothetical protein
MRFQLHIIWLHYYLIMIPHVNKFLLKFLLKNIKLLFELNVFLFLYSFLNLSMFWLSQLYQCFFSFNFSLLSQLLLQHFIECSQFRHLLLNLSVQLFFFLNRNFIFLLQVLHYVIKLSILSLSVLLELFLYFLQLFTVLCLNFIEFLFERPNFILILLVLMFSFSCYALFKLFHLQFFFLQGFLKFYILLL